MKFLLFLFRTLVLWAFITSTLSALMEHRFVKRECVSNVCVWSVEYRL